MQTEKVRVSCKRKTIVQMPVRQAAKNHTVAYEAQAEKRLVEPSLFLATTARPFHLRCLSSTCAPVSCPMRSRAGAKTVLCESGGLSWTRRSGSERVGQSVILAHP